MEKALKIAVEAPIFGYRNDQNNGQTARPVQTDARHNIRATAEGNDRTAQAIGRGPNPFASICGLACGAPYDTAYRRGDGPNLLGHSVYRMVVRHAEKHGFEAIGVSTRANKGDILIDRKVSRG